MCVFPSGLRPLRKIHMETIILKDGYFTGFILTYSVYANISAIADLYEIINNL